MFTNRTDPILIRFKDQIKDFGYTSNEITSYENFASRACYSDRARLVESRLKDPSELCEIDVRAITPSKFFSEQIPLKTYDTSSGLSIAE